MIYGKRQVYPRTFYWRTRRQGAMRSGNWKYVRDGKSEFLFDLTVDEHEAAGFGDRHPDVLARLRNDFAKWESEMKPYKE